MTCCFQGKNELRVHLTELNSTVKYYILKISLTSLIGITLFLPMPINGIPKKVSVKGWCMWPQIMTLGCMHSTKIW